MSLRVLSPSSPPQPQLPAPVRACARAQSTNLFHCRPTSVKFIATIHNPVRIGCSARSSSPKTVPDTVAEEGTKTPPWWGRRWSSADVGTAGVVLLMHALCLFAPFAFTRGAVCAACALYVATGLLGITLSFHRNLSHRSFRLPKWLEYAFAYCGVQALQGNPIDWVSTHRYHHQYCDSARDPHSPLDGFWFSHMSWLFDNESIVQRCGEPNNVGDLERQPFYRYLRETYLIHPIALAVFLYVVGGFPFIVWGMGVRIVWVYHITWLVNSACHVWGRQSWNTGDLSRNNWWVAILAFGEGWHNNHHAFEHSACHGLEWWQIDMTWYVVWLLRAMGLATDVKLPSPLQRQRMCFGTDLRETL
ncbi:hypothetical protein QJS04_geneDACA016166 [Acorus gramineus]|uniref:Fatty acid desaturase domain-containing protein n=1 Tax=Acorus gramineus TaxID=55184 RepID=A0AAV9ANP8_ACOGR|nr:hypothetical protein QJS04_geneDACA016166 [Acorus gramineus]